MPDFDTLEDAYKKEVGKKIKQCRKKRHMSQGQLNKEIGGDPHNTATVSKYESGSDHLRIVPFFHIVKALGVTVNDLLPDSLAVKWDPAFTEFLALTPEHQDVVRKLIQNLRDAEKQE